MAVLSRDFGLYSLYHRDICTCYFVANINKFVIILYQSICNIFLRFELHHSFSVQLVTVNFNSMHQIMLMRPRSVSSQMWMQGYRYVLLTKTACRSVVTLG